MAILWVVVLAVGAAGLAGYAVYRLMSDIDIGEDE